MKIKLLLKIPVPTPDPYNRVKTPPKKNENESIKKTTLEIPVPKGNTVIVGIIATEICLDEEL